MRVAIVGGTGFVGGYLVDALLAAGHKPSLLVRPGSEHKLHRAAQCRVVTGDLHSATAIGATLDGCDAVAYCAGILRESSTGTFEGVQYEGVERVATLARDRQISRFLLMSANGVRQPGTAYQETKLRAEHCVLDMGFDATIFRPSVIFGDPRGAIEIGTQLVRDMVKQPFPAVRFSNWKLGRDHISMSPVHVEDVARAFVVALRDPATIGQVYPLGGPEVLSWSQMIERTAAAIGSKKLIVPIPIGLMRLAATVFDRFAFFPVTRDQLTMLEEDNTADPQVLSELIDRTPRAFSAENLGYLAA